MTLEQALERIRQLEQMFLTISAMTAPEKNYYLDVQNIIQLADGDVHRWRTRGTIDLTEHEIERAESMFPRITPEDPSPRDSYVAAKKRLLLAKQHYGRFILMDDNHIGIAGLPPGTDLRGLIADEISQEYDLGRDAIRYLIRGHIPRTAIEDRKR